MPTNNAMFTSRQFLIIGGTSKAGTTSLFAYLSDHPEICASSLKETRFFLDHDYPLPCTAPFQENLAEYQKYFSQCSTPSNMLLMEATPDYLYSSTALRIGEILPNAKIIFILRDPVDRLVSWFKYAKQRGMLDINENISSYINYQLENPVSTDTPVHLRALKQGCYCHYLSAFQQNMPEKILLLSYETLNADPAQLMKKICSFANIDGHFFSDYLFEVANESKKVRFLKIDIFYRNIRRKIAYHVINIQWLLQLFRWLNKPIKNLVQYNYQKADSVEIPVNLRKKLENYYADELKLLANLKQGIDT